MLRLSYLFMVVVPVLLLTPHLAWAQQEETYIHKTEHFVWLRYTLELPLSKTWSFEQEIEERMQIKPMQQDEVRLRSQAEYTLGQGWALELGLMASWESGQVEDQPAERVSRLELRPHQQLSYEHSLGEKWSFEHSYKVEERFFRNKNNQGQYKGAGMSLEELRFKYELEAAFQVNSWLGLTAFNELVFYTASEEDPNPFDRNESGAGVAFTLSESFGFEIQYNYRFNPDFSDHEIVHQHVGRLLLTHSLLSK